MFTKTKLALAAALIVGAASVAQANEPTDEYGGYRVGPLGQRFGGVNPTYHRSMRYGGGAYAYVPGFRIPPQHYRTWRWDWDD